MPFTRCELRETDSEHVGVVLLLSNRSFPLSLGSHHFELVLKVSCGCFFVVAGLRFDPARDLLQGGIDLRTVLDYVGEAIESFNNLFYFVRV